MRGTTLDVMMRALREVGGYLVWRADDGEQFVVMSKREFDRLNREGAEVQLALSTTSADKATSPAAKLASTVDQVPRGVDELLDRINREIALYRESEEEAYIEEDSKGGEDIRKVRFEPLRGDLPPELQE